MRAYPWIVLFVFLVLTVASGYVVYKRAYDNLYSQYNSVRESYCIYRLSGSSMPSEYLEKKAIFNGRDVVFRIYPRDGNLPEPRLKHEAVFYSLSDKEFLASEWEDGTFISCFFIATRNILNSSAETWQCPEGNATLYSNGNITSVCSSFCISSDTGLSQMLVSEGCFRKQI